MKSLRVEASCVIKWSTMSPIENAIERQAEEVLGQKDLVDLTLPRFPGVLLAADARQKGGG